MAHSPDHSTEESSPEGTDPGQENPEPTGAHEQDAAEQDAASEEAQGNGEAEGQKEAPSDNPGPDLADVVDLGAGVETEADKRIRQLESTVQALEGRLRTVSAAYKQQQDELKLTQERLERQAQVKEELRKGEVVAALFEPFQNLRRSIQAIEKGATGDEALKGLQMIEHQTMEAFRALGLEEVPGKGARFDPNLHEAISVIPVTDAALDDVVVEVFSAGYRIGSRLIQPARVVIGRLQEPAGEA